jgi:hypothetical protein
MEVRRFVLFPRFDAQLPNAAPNVWLRLLGRHGQTRPAYCFVSGCLRSCVNSGTLRAFLASWRARWEEVLIVLRTAMDGSLR